MRCIVGGDGGGGGGGGGGGAYDGGCGENDGTSCEK